jgi:hypothetical protein
VGWVGWAMPTAYGFGAIVILGAIAAIVVVGNAHPTQRSAQHSNPGFVLGVDPRTPGAAPFHRD